MAKSTVRLRVANITDIGKNPSRVKNEDFLGHFEGDYGDLFLVCDGMGGHEGGEIASRLAVDSIRKYFETNYILGEEQNTIAKSIDFAHQKIVDAVQQNPDLSGMGTTLVLLLIQGVSYWIAHSGDSRIYLSRDGSLNQLTKDHSEVQEMVESGIITQEQAATHPRRNFITKAVGHFNYAPEIAGPYILKQDDVFLLCSDGLTEYLKDDELHSHLEEEPAIACRNLVDIANERGGSDNITLQIIHVQQCSPFSVEQELSAPRKKTFIPPLAVIVTILVFIAAVVWYSSRVLTVQQPKKPKVEKAEMQKVKKVKVKKVKTSKAAQKEAALTDLTAIESAVDAELDAFAPNSSASEKKYQEFFAKVSNKTTQAKQLKFINSPKGKQMVYILPGRAVYVSFDLLFDASPYKMKADEIQALIALGVVKSGQKSTLTKDNWKQVLFQTGTTPLDEATYTAAKELYKKADAENGDQLFNNSKRFARFRNLIGVGPANLSMEVPK